MSGGGSGTHTPDVSASPGTATAPTAASAHHDNNNSSCKSGNSATNEQPSSTRSVRFSDADQDPPTTPATAAATATATAGSALAGASQPQALPALTLPAHPPSPLAHAPYQSTHDWTDAGEGDIEATGSGSGSGSGSSVAAVAGKVDFTGTGAGASTGTGTGTASSRNRGRADSGVGVGAGTGAGAGGMGSGLEGLGQGLEQGLGYFGGLVSQAKDQMAAGIAAGLTPDQVGEGGMVVGLTAFDCFLSPGVDVLHSSHHIPLHTHLTQLMAFVHSSSHLSRLFLPPALHSTPPHPTTQIDEANKHANTVARVGWEQTVMAGSGALRGIIEVERALEMLTLGAYYKYSSTAFVTFNSRITESIAQQMLLSHDAMEISHAPNPHDIIWENVSIPKSQVRAEGERRVG